MLGSRLIAGRLLDSRLTTGLRMAIMSILQRESDRFQAKIPQVSPLQSGFGCSEVKSVQIILGAAIPVFAGFEAIRINVSSSPIQPSVIVWFIC